jgi:riboflavin synthase
MFTGIIQAVGRIAALEARGGDTRLTIEATSLDFARSAPGDSIAVNGVCLTAVELHDHRFAADVSRETLRLTTLGDLAAGSAVNLEPALALGAPLGGHLVSGHVDGVGSLLSRQPEARSTRMRFALPVELMRYAARKGSICIDGVSLTVNDVDDHGIGVNIVPHTLEQTIIGSYVKGSRVNIEVDLIARYLERLMQAGDAGVPE